jgi:cyclophilin family peptidyl-prolyl cis-trans isomerase
MAFGGSNFVKVVCVSPIRQVEHTKEHLVFHMIVSHIAVQLRLILTKSFWISLILFTAVGLMAACGGGQPEVAVAPVATNIPTSIVAAAPVETASTPVPGTADLEVRTAGPPPAEMADGPAAALAPAERNGMYDAPPPMEIDSGRYYYATLKTEQGDIRVQLFADRTPITVNNFVFLARAGFYNDTTFHRVIDGFMAQAGDPIGAGTGGPGYRFADEFYPGLDFDQSGLLAMANSGPNTNGSQFFITFGPTEWLNGMHTIFGKVIEGEEVLANITRRDPGASAPADIIYTIIIDESENSELPTPTPAPPTATPTSTPTPFAPTSLNDDERPLAQLPATARVNYFNTPPEVVIDPSRQYRATITTSKGAIEVELYADRLPVAVNNFVVLVELGFYDNTPISLVRPNDSIVFGVPDNNPLNDAGYKFPAEIGANQETGVGSITYIPFERLDDGTVLSSSSQILVALIEPPAQFSQQLSFFGQITDGFDVLQTLTTEDSIERIVIAVAD